MQHSQSNNQQGGVDVNQTTDNLQTAKKVNDLARWVDDYRYRYSRQWYINWAFYENNHFVWWNNAQNIITPINPSPGQVMRFVPKARRQIEAIQNMILSSDIRWETTPVGAPSSDDKISQRVNDILQYKWDCLDIEGRLDEAVLYAMYLPYSLIEVGWDKNLTDGVNSMGNPQKGDIFIQVRDAFDCLIPPVDDIEDAPFVIITYREQMDKIKKNPMYSNTDRLQASPDYAYSFFKEARIEQKLAIQATLPIYEELSGVIVKECWKKEIDKDGNINLRLMTVVGDTLILDKLYKGVSNYPFVMYKPFSGNIYQPAWIEKFIPLNKSLDVMISQVENYTNVMTRGRYALPKGASFTRMSNNDGEFVFTDTGAPPNQIPMEPMPAHVFNHIANLEKWIEEQGVSTVAMGKVPKGVKAYKAIESMKQSDFSNLRVPVKNLENTLTRLGEKILDLMDRNILTPRTVYNMDKGKPDYFEIIGKSGSKLPINSAEMNTKPTQDNPKPQPPVIISKDYKVIATIGGGISYTNEGKQQSMLELYQEGLVGQEQVLEAFSIGNIGDIVDQQLEQAVTGQSFTQTPDFQAAASGKFGPQAQQHAQGLTQAAMQPENMANNPLIQAERQQKMKKGRK